MASILTFDKVSFRYPNGVEALRNASFTVDAGESVSIVGPNGGGKSTLLKLALGLLEPSSGSVALCGQSPTTGCRLAGYIPQHTQVDARFPITVAGVIGIGLSKHPNRKARTRELLTEVGCDGLQQRQFSALSGGQQQRILMARALATEPKILLMDEPMAHIDAEAQDNLAALLGHLRQQITIVTVTHDLNFVEASVTKVICVDRTLHMHPTEAVRGDLRERLFGPRVALIRHDACLEGCCDDKPDTEGLSA